MLIYLTCKVIIASYRLPHVGGINRLNCMYPSCMDFAATPGAHSTRARGPSATNKVLSYTQVHGVWSFGFAALVTNKMVLEELFFHYI